MEILTVAVMDPFNVYAPPSQESLESRPGADATEVQIRNFEQLISASPDWQFASLYILEKNFSSFELSDLSQTFQKPPILN